MSERYDYEPYVTDRSRMELYELARAAGFPALTVRDPKYPNVYHLHGDDAWDWWVTATNTAGRILAAAAAMLTERLATSDGRR